MILARFIPEKHYMLNIINCHSGQNSLSILTNLSERSTEPSKRGSFLVKVGHGWPLTLRSAIS